MPQYESPPFAPMGAQDLTCPPGNTGPEGPEGPAGPAGAAGATGPSGVPATFIMVDMTDDQDFNGTGAGGAIHLSPWTILQNDDDWDGTLIWDFQLAGVAAGWVVQFAISNDPALPASLDIRNNNVNIVTLTDTNVPDTAPLLTPFAIFFDGTGWQILGNRIDNVA